MITLNGLELPDSLIWVDRYAQKPIASSSRWSYGGRHIITSLQLIAGQPITLQGGENNGWIEKSAADTLLTMANIVGGLYTLVFGAETYSVAFRHYDPPAVDLVPFIPRTTHDASDYLTGTIKLVTV